MKGFKLFKRLGALITAVAVLASMGTVAFADETETPDPTITNVVADIDEAVVNPTNDEGLYTVTVDYKINNWKENGMGMTMLAYSAGSTGDELKAEGVETTGFTPYEEGYIIAYVAQDAPVLKEGSSDTYTISFNVDTTSDVKNAIEVGKGEKILILLGGDGVKAPVATLVTTLWDATEAELRDGDGNAVVELDEAIEFDRGGDVELEVLFADAIADYDVYLKDASGNDEILDGDYEVAITDELTAAELEAHAGATHKATLTVDNASVITDGYNIDDSAVYACEVFFAVETVWTADTLVVAETGYEVYKDQLTGDPIDEDTVRAAVEAAVEAKVIKVAKGGTALEGTIAAAVVADAVSVAFADEAAFDIDAAENTDVTFVVTLAAGEYVCGDDTVTVPERTKNITVVYGPTAPVTWAPTTATYEGAVDNIETAVATDYDFETYVAGELNGATVNLTDGTHNGTITLLTGDDANFTVEAEAGAPGAGDVATVTATVTLADGAEGTAGAIVGYEDAEVVSFEVTFTAVILVDWTVTDVTYEGSVANIEEVKPATFDFAGYVAGELEGETVTLSDDNNHEADVRLGEDVEFTVETEVGTPGVGGVTDITATVTITAGTVTAGGVEVTIPADTTFDVVFTSLVQTYAYGDVDHSGGDRPVTFDDAVLTAKYAVSGSSVGTFDVTLANVDGNDAGQNGVTFDDAIEIAKKAVSPSYKFPIEL